MGLSLRMRHAAYVGLAVGWGVATAEAQSCYYPNGDLSTSDGPCSSEPGAACCPLNWQCLSNGLCYLEAQQYYGRYTCTDKSWSSEQCPSFCTDNLTDFGDQAVQQCSDGSYCCDHNRDPSNYCCDTSNNSDFFPLSKGSSYAFVSQLAATTSPQASFSSVETVRPVAADSATQPTFAATQPTFAPAASSTFDPTTTMTSLIRLPTPSSSSSIPTTILITSKITNEGGGSATDTNGKISILVITSIVTNAPSSITTNSPGAPPAPQDQGDPSSTRSTSNRTAAIAGGVGGSVGAILIGLAIIFVLYRRKQKRQNKPFQSAVPLAEPKPLDYMYKGNETGIGNGETDSPEIDGREVSAPASTSPYRGVHPTEAFGVGRLLGSGKSKWSRRGGSKRSQSEASELAGSPTPSPRPPAYASFSPHTEHDIHELPAEQVERR